MVVVVAAAVAVSCRPRSVCVQSALEMPVHGVVRSPAAIAVNVDVLGAQFSTDLQFVISISFYDEILGNELWHEYSARGWYC